MTRRRPLHELQRLAEHAADAASREISDRLHTLRAEEERLNQVRHYQHQYEQLSVTPAPGLTLGTLQGRRRFATRLREASERQQSLVAQEETRYQRQVERWRDARAQALALQRFNERIRDVERQRHARQEQRRLDEIALQKR